MATYTPKHEDITGADLTGSSPSTNRTYTVANSGLQIAQLQIVIDNTILQHIKDFTVSGNTITFLNTVWDDQNITIDYNISVAITSLFGSSYTDTLRVVRVSGIGVEVFNELLGTGDSANKSFDLANGNVIADSYTLKYSDTGNDANDLTELTETTHYSINKDTGLILLTSAGVTALGTSNLYIDYVHSPKLSDTQLQTYIEPASLEVEKMTGNYWGSPKNSTEYFDMQLNDYPTTDEPYMVDYDLPTEFQLSKKGILSVRGAYVVGVGLSIKNAQVYDSVGVSYTDVSTEINSRGGTSFQPFASTTASGDYLYIGISKQFFSLNTILDVEGVTSGTNTIEYYNGSSWTAFSVTESETGVLNFETEGKMSWNTLSGWTQTSVNSSSSLYFIRIVANDTYATEPKILTIYPSQDDVIQREIDLYNVRHTDNGRVILHNFNQVTGSANMRIDYRHGYSSVPDNINELTALVAGIRAFVNISGGSYDDATSFTIGRESVGIGEVYVNIREVISQAKKRIQEIMDSFGKKLDVV